MHDTENQSAVIVSCPTFVSDVSSKGVTDVEVVSSPKSVVCVVWEVFDNVFVDAIVSVLVVGVSTDVNAIVVYALITIKVFLKEGVEEDRAKKI